jgi:protoheme IX farnesyltransferase
MTSKYAPLNTPLDRKGIPAVKPGRGLSAAGSYLQVLKPLPSLLLAYIGVGAAVIAGGGQIVSRLWLVLAAVLVASAGANGLTNYLDRDIDARMKRTCTRALASRAIDPPEKALPLIIGLIIAGLGLAWLLGPWVFAVDAGGTLVAGTWRKKITCVYPQGVIASCAPVLMGWLAIRNSTNLELWLICLLIAAWLPLHVWSVNIAHRDDYRQAGLNYFPINLEVRDSVKVLLAFAVALYAVSLALYFTGDFGWFYLVLANVLGIAMIAATARLVMSHTAGDAWRLFRVSSFPYLGLIFLAMCLDIWLVR